MLSANTDLHILHVFRLTAAIALLVAAVVFTYQSFKGRGKELDTRSFTLLLSTLSIQAASQLAGRTFSSPDDETAIVLSVFTLVLSWIGINLLALKRK